MFGMMRRYDADCGNDAPHQDQTTKRSRFSDPLTRFEHWRLKLYRYFNDIRVRSFILNGAPFFDASQNKTASGRQTGPRSRMGRAL
jgi:hypothetical protein